MKRNIEIDNTTPEKKEEVIELIVVNELPTQPVREVIEDGHKVKLITTAEGIGFIISKLDLEFAKLNKKMDDILKKAEDD